MAGSALRLGKRIFEPFPALDTLTQTVALALGLIAGGTYLGVHVDGVVGLAVILGVLLALALRAAYLLQRELDAEPELSLELHPEIAYHERVGMPSTHLGPTGPVRLCAVTASATGDRVACSGRLIACEQLGPDGFRPFDRFKRPIDLVWLNPEINEYIDIEPDVPEGLVVSIASESDGVHLGPISSYKSVAIEPGEYRIRVRLRSQFGRPNFLDRWFQLSHRGEWNEVELAEDPA